MIKTRIVIDIMSGDNAPDAIIEGALSALDEKRELILVGSKEVTDKIIPPENCGDLIRFKNSSSVVTMDDNAQSAMNEKKDSSMAVAMQTLKDGEADVLISAGNTGALFSAATLMVRRINGIRRAAITALVPLEKPFILLDAGANVEILPENLVQFAEMGSFYAKEVLGVASPKVGLLNNGTESTKGTQTLKDTYQLLNENTSIDFYGNVESRELPFCPCDVVVCDGFTGNIAVKLIEGMGGFMKKKLKDLFMRSAKTKIAGLLCKQGINELKKSVDPREYGAAPILGIRKPVIKAHGNADMSCIYHTIIEAEKYYQSGVTEKFVEMYKKKGDENAKH